LLAEVLATGDVPDDATLRSAVTHYRSVADRSAGERELRVRLKRIANAVASGLPDEAEKLAEAALHGLAQYDAEAGADVKLPPREREDTSRKRGPGISAAEGALRDLLQAAPHTGGVNMASRDVKRILDLVDGDDEARDAFGKALQEAGDDIRRTWASGAQGPARTLARERAAELAQHLREPEPVDPTDGIDDPRALAALVPRGGHR